MPNKVRLTYEQYTQLQKEQNAFPISKETPVMKYLKSYGVDALHPGLKIQVEPSQHFVLLWVEEPELNPAPVNKDATPSPYMSFGDAMNLLIKSGKRVKRKHWGGYWEIMELNDMGVHIEQLIIAKLKDGGYAPAQPYQADMLANDWMEVE